MGAVNTTYTFTPTDTITSTKMNNIIDETVMTSDAVLGGSGGSGGLDISSGKLSISANAINSSRLAANSVTSTNIVDGTIINADISPTAAIAGTKIAASFGNQNITANGDIGLEGTASDYTAAVLNNTSGVETQVFANAALNGGIATVTNHPMLLITNNTERIRIESGGNVGIGTPTPGAKLEIKGGASIDANPEMRVSGTSGYIDMHNSLGAGGYNGITSSGDKAFIFSDGTVNTGNLVIAPWTDNTSGIRINSSGNVGIKKASPSTALDVNGTVTATAFAGPLTGNASTATTASTVSNGAITAAKLDGAQSGSAPIFGIRAFVNFEGRATNGNCTIRSSNNVSSVSRVALGKYVVYFNVPMQGTGYTVVASAGTSPGSPRFACADRSTAALGSIKIETDNQSGAAADFNENNVMVIE
jgi:hypothetical protein